MRQQMQDSNLLHDVPHNANGCVYKHLECKYLPLMHIVLRLVCIGWPSLCHSSILKFIQLSKLGNSL